MPEGRKWKKGQSGNPAGRPKGSGVRDRLKRLVTEEDGGRIADALCDAATEAALKGDFRFWKEIVDSVDGPIAQKIQAEVGSTVKIIRAEDEQLLDEADAKGANDENDREGKAG